MRETKSQKIDRLQRQRDEWMSKCHEAEKTIRKMQRTMNIDDNQTINDIQKEIKSLRSENERLTIYNNEYMDMKKEFKELQKENRQLKNDSGILEELKKEVKSLRKDSKALEETRVLLFEAKQEIRSMRDDHQKLEELRTVVREINKEKRSLKEKVIELTSDNNYLRENMQTILNGGIIASDMNATASDPVVTELKEMVMEDAKSRLEYFNNKCWEDKWGNAFFNDNLIINMNPNTGEELTWWQENNILQFIKEYYVEIWSLMKNDLSEFQLLFENKKIEETIYKQKKDSLGRKLLDNLMEDDRFKPLFKDNINAVPF